MFKEKWEVKGERPEEIYKDPVLFYTKEEAERYNNSSGMRNVQQKIANRIIALLELELGTEKVLLDVGCGTGNTLEIFNEFGFDCTGLDVSKEMLKFAKEKGLKVKQGSITELNKAFPTRKFDLVVSISAMQWLQTKEDYKKAGESIKSVLKKGGKSVIQFYPKSSEELERISKIFANIFDKVEIIIDNPDNPRKRLVFLVCC